jgi:hypothetical protein
MKDLALQAFPKYDGFALCNYRAEGFEPSASLNELPTIALYFYTLSPIRKNVADTINRIFIDAPIGITESK